MSVKKIHTRYKNEVNSDREDAELLSFRFISEIDKCMEAGDISKKDLAQGIGTSASYVTQLFKGDKLLNMEILSKIERALEITFKIEAVYVDNLSITDFYGESEPYFEFECEQNNDSRNILVA